MGVDLLKIAMIYSRNRNIAQNASKQNLIEALGVLLGRDITVMRSCIVAYV